jgi:hypothetical protein
MTASATDADYLAEGMILPDRFRSGRRLLVKMKCASRYPSE